MTKGLFANIIKGPLCNLAKVDISREVKTVIHDMLDKFLIELLLLCMMDVLVKCRALLCL